MFLAMLYLYKSHNTLFYPKKICIGIVFRFLLGHLHAPGEIANNDYAKLWGAKEVYYGICPSRELFIPARNVVQRIS